MDDMYDEELDADAAAMAEAMGFTGFGMRNKKRKFNPNADSSVAEEPAVPSFTGANTAPLGRRRPMNLPPPESEGGGANADEIDLNEAGNVDWEGQRGGGGDGVDDVVVGGKVAEPQHIDASRPSGNVLPEGLEGLEMQARINSIVAGSASPAGTAAKDQKPQYQQPQVGKGARWSGHIANAAHAAKAAGLPWWEGPWDPKLIDRMIDNPWDRLEKQRGLGSRGTWGRKDDDNTAGLTAPEETGTQAIGVAGEAVVA